MAGTTVYYNGVCLQDCLTKDWEHVIEYDESGYQAIANRFRITVESTIVSYHNASSESSRTTDYHPSSVATARALDQSVSSVKQLGVDTLAEVESLLSQNCMDFVMTIHEASTDSDKTMPKGYFQRDGANRIILAATGVAKASSGTFGATKLVVYDPQINAAAFTEIEILRHDVLDCDNGPKPIRVALAEEIKGSRVFRVSVTFEICRPIVTDWIADEETLTYDPRKAKGVMKNKWNVTDSIDDEGAVTHRIRGTLTVSDIRFKPNAMRLMAFPLAFPFARFAGRENEVSEDGKTLGYTITHKHAGNAPPLGVRDYTCQYVEEGSFGVKHGYHAAVNVRVKGWYHRSTDNPAVTLTDAAQKLVLLRGAITLLYSRIRGINQLWNPLPGQNPVGTILRSFRVIENTKEPELSLMCSVQFCDTAGDHSEFPARMKNVGAPIQIAGYDPRWWPIDNEWGRLLNDDVENVFLRSSFLPQSHLGANRDIDYMNQQRHKSGEWAYMTPRVTQLPVASSDLREHVPTPTSGTTATDPGSISPETVPVTPNPIPAPVAFTAYVSNDLYGTPVLTTLAPRTAVAAGIQTGISAVQDGGFAYLTWTSETLTDTSSGLIQLPLSRPRNTPKSQLGFVPGSGDSITAKQTSTVVRLHAGKAKRVYTVHAERLGDWPEMPKPMPIIVRKNAIYTGGGSTTYEVANIERLLSFDFLPESHDLIGIDGCSKKFVIDARYVYALDQPLGATEAQNGLAGGSIFSTSPDLTKIDFIPVMTNPTLKTTFAQSGIRDQTSVFKNGYID